MSKKFISVLRLATDLAIINISFILAAIFAQSWNTLLQRQYMFVLLLLSNILWFVTARATKLNSDLSSRSLTSEAIILFNNIFIQITVFIFFIFTIKEDLFTRNFILYFSAGSYFLILSKSVVLKQIIIKARQNGKNLRKVVIIGNNKTGIDFKNSIIDNSNYGYKFIGFIDSNNTSETIASINEFESFLNSEQVDEVIIALDVKEFDTIRKVLRICDRKAVKSFIIPDYFQLLSNKFQLDMFGNYPVIRVRNNPLEEFHWRFLKRTFDFFFALILFAAVFWWLFLIIGFGTEVPTIKRQEKVIFPCGYWTSGFSGLLFFLAQFYPQFFNYLLLVRLQIFRGYAYELPLKLVFNILYLVKTLYCKFS